MNPRKLRLLAVMAILALALHGCSVEDAIDQVSQTLGTVRGTVVDGRGAPVVSALVTVENAGYSALTNVQGQYVLTLPAGTFTLRADHGEAGAARATVTVPGAGRETRADPGNGHAREEKVCQVQVSVPHDGPPTNRAVLSMSS